MTFFIQASENNQMKAADALEGQDLACTYLAIHELGKRCYYYHLVLLSLKQQCNVWVCLAAAIASRQTVIHTQSAAGVPHME